MLHAVLLEVFQQHLVLRVERSHAVSHFLKVRPGVRRLGAAVLVVFPVGRFGFDVDRRHLGRFVHGRFGFELRGIDESDHQFRHACARVANAGILAEHELRRGRQRRQGLESLDLAFLDAFGDADLAFAREQFDRSHFPHVHAHGIGRAADLAIHRRCQGGCRFLGFVLVVGRHRNVGKQNVFGIGRMFMHRNAHVIEHGDDVFDLLGIDEIVGQMVVDLGEGQVTLFFTL